MAKNSSELAQPIPMEKLADEPWLRYAGETDEAFQAFTIYRDMGPERSLAKVADELGKSTSLMERWSRRDHWRYRVNSFADYQEQLRVEAQNEAIVRMAERHAQQAMAGVSALMLPALALVRKMNEDPELVSNLSRQDALALLSFVQRSANPLSILMQAERLARGEPTEITKTTSVGVGVAVSEEDADPSRLGAILDVLDAAGLIDVAGAADEAGDEPEAADLDTMDS